MLQMNGPEATMEDAQHQHPFFWKTPLGIGASLLAVVVSLYLYLTHKDHVVAALPFLLLAVCPLMHVFMHRGHGGHSHGRQSAAPGPTIGKSDHG